jgi:hypothetical protein
MNAGRPRIIATPDLVRKGPRTPEAKKTPLKVKKENIHTHLDDGKEPRKGRAGDAEHKREDEIRTKGEGDLTEGTKKEDSSRAEADKGDFDDLAERWEFSISKPISNELKIQFSMVLRKAIYEIFSSQVYEWNGRMYIQEDITPTGAAISGAVAHIRMDRWARVFFHILRVNMIILLVFLKYVDNVNEATKAILRGSWWDKECKILRHANEEREGHANPGDRETVKNEVSQESEQSGSGKPQRKEKGSKTVEEEEERSQGTPGQGTSRSKPLPTWKPYCSSHEPQAVD